MTRIDAWIWAVRLVKTRTAAAQACRSGHVKLNGNSVKPAQTVAPGDTIRVWANHREVTVEVVDAEVAKRVGAAVAQQCYVDHTPPPPPKELFASMPKRDRGAGRPTKRDRRKLDELMGRSR